jgi:hypothetical protein
LVFLLWFAGRLPVNKSELLSSKKAGLWVVILALLSLTMKAHDVLPKKKASMTTLMGLFTPVIVSVAVKVRPVIDREGIRLISFGLRIA